MTERQIDLALRLARARFLPGSYDKRFCRDMASIAANNPAFELSEKQATYLEKTAQRYRRQIGESPHE